MSKQALLSPEKQRKTCTCEGSHGWPNDGSIWIQCTRKKELFLRSHEVTTTINHQISNRNCNITLLDNIVHQMVIPPKTKSTLVYRKVLVVSDTSNSRFEFDILIKPSILMNLKSCASVQSQRSISTILD